MKKPFALIIEDEREAAAMFRHVFDVVGYRTEIVFNSQISVERLANSQPHIVILNWDIPGVPGNEILRKIGEDERLSHTKVIVITGYSQLPYNLSAEPDLLLYKPVSMEQFSDFIERFHLKVKFQTTTPLKDEPWDRVTGLYNRSFFENRLDFALQQKKEHGQYMFAVLAVSIDQDDRIKNQIHIKNWMMALRETAKALQATVRPTDTIARFYQGDFYILIENMPDKDIPQMIASRVQNELHTGLAGLGQQEPIPIRISTLLCDRPYENVREVITAASTTQPLAICQKVA